ncbi:fatty acid hydroxylase family protein [Nocardioides eburneiflavus]|uniref:Fatty acid hydroxylase family protein n=1 Tax=Nocardioides eburneiflavus TaxID=2518372 RepID=A0A4Z1CDK1_9ACTN|nr:sterol desaturase family protein [Nocardioides eburneiflavus]TGN63228.1 fatty acid hydroxylase family protein [Nocardioides eburneiflavus]
MSDDAVQQLARQRLEAAERRHGRRRTVSLAETGRAFWRYPSPWIISGYLAATLVARVVVGGWSWLDLLAPLVFLAVFPVVEWLIHVFILHWRPRTVAGVEIDTLLARDHRRHHADPRDVPLVFVPCRALLWVVALPGLAIPLGVGALLGAELSVTLSFVLTLAVVLLTYEWTHYVIHSDYKPRTRAYKAIWRNHRLHHHKSEHYWFSVTTSGTSDRLLGTYPDPASVPTSPTAKDLHGRPGSS